MLTIAEIQQDRDTHYVTYLKYVRVSGQYRFVFAAEWHTPDHAKMLQKGETAESAAYVKVYNDRCEVHDYSMTLNIGPLLDDEDNIAKLLGEKL